MALNNGYEEVPLGKVGTGDAVVFDSTPSTEALAGNIGALLNKPLIEKALKQQKLAAMNKSYSTGDADIMKPASGTMYTPEINTLIAKHLQKGATYRAAGVDIYNPDYLRPDQVKAHEDYMNERTQLMSLIQTRDKMEDYRNQMLKSYDETKHDPESKAAFEKFFEQNKTGNRLQKMFFKGENTLPTFSPRFNQAEFDKSIEVPVDQKEVMGKGPDGTEIKTISKFVPLGKVLNQVESRYRGDPIAKKNIEQKIGAPIGSVLGTIDEDEIRQHITEAYKEPEGVKELATLGITGYDTQAFKQLVDAETKQQLGVEQKYFNVINDDVKRLKATKGESDSWDYDTTLVDLMLKRRADARAGSREGRAAKKDNEAQSLADMRHENIVGIINGNVNYVKDLDGILKAQNNGSGAKLMDNGKLLRVTYIGENKNGQKAMITRDVNLTPGMNNDADAYTAVNRVLSDVTGKEIDIESLKVKTRKSETPTTIVVKKNQTGQETAIPQPIYEKLNKTFSTDFMGLYKYLQSPEGKKVFGTISQNEAKEYVNSILGKSYFNNIGSKNK